MEAAKFGPRLTKDLLNVSAISFFSNISPFFVVTRLGRRKLVTLLFPIICFITSNVFLTLYLYKSIRSEDYFFFDFFFKESKNVLFCVQFSFFSEFIFFKNCSYNLYFFFDHFTKPLVTQGLLKLFGLFLIFYLEMLHWKDPRELLKIHCMQFFGIFLKYTFPVNDREKSFKIGYRFIIYFSLCYVHQLITRILH